MDASARRRRATEREIAIVGQRDKIVEDNDEEDVNEGVEACDDEDYNSDDFVGVGDVFRDDEPEEVQGPRRGPGGRFASSSSTTGNIISLNKIFLYYCIKY